MNTNKILIVEDDDQLASSTAQILRLHKYATVRAASRDAAFRHLAEVDHDQLILLDLSLQNDRGEELIKECRAAGLQLPPVIIASAQPLSELRQAARIVGAVDCLRKPYSAKELLAVVEKAIDGARGSSRNGNQIV